MASAELVSGRVLAALTGRPHADRFAERRPAARAARQLAQRPFRIEPPKPHQSQRCHHLADAGHSESGDYPPVRRA